MGIANSYKLKNISQVELDIEERIRGHTKMICRDNLYCHF